MSMPSWPQQQLQQHPVSFMSMPSWPQQQREQHPVLFMHKHAIFAITTTRTTPCIIHEHAILVTTTTPCIIHEHVILATIATGTTPCVIYSWACHLRHNINLHHSFMRMPSSPQHPLSFIGEHVIFPTTPCIIHWWAFHLPYNTLYHSLVSIPSSPQHPVSFIGEHSIFPTTPSIIHSWAYHLPHNTLYHSFVGMLYSPQQHPVAYHCWLQAAVAYPASVALWEGRRRASVSSRGPSSSTWAPPSAAEASSTLTRFSLLATAFTPRESVLHSLCVSLEQVVL